MKSAANIHGATIPWRLLDEYSVVESVYDEMVTGRGVLRPHCETFVRSLEALGRHEFASRWDSAKRAIRENGVTYNIYGDPQGMDRPWELDMVPLLMSAEDWSHLETALIQRTRLLNLILADIYGPQRLMRGGMLPPSLVFANAAFLRACHGIRVPRDIFLHLHAVDLARSPDGQWWVLADRTQAPSGAGYALENRMVMLRSLPEAFRDCHVQRLASFFRAQRDTLTMLAPGRQEQPKVVLLTPGPYNETYFEHAYLARYLGFTLVEGGDLTVRDRRVFIKTLDGLQPVDVIFRRLDDSFSDPLELRGDSSLGVAGLVEAARAGHVTIANALGSGVIETPAMMPFLPALCRHLLGEDLLLPSVATWWCGQPAGLQHVIAQLDQLVIKRAFPSETMEPVFGRKLGQREKASLTSKLHARPHDFVGQEQVALSTAPVWHPNKLEPRPVVFRTYIAAAGDSYAVMPGGLTRVSSAPDVPIVSMQRGGGSKDTWVRSNGPVSSVSLLAPPGAPIRLERASTDLPSRVAENLFWLGRYVERAEHTVRLLRSFVARLADQDTTDDPGEVTALLHVLVALKLLPDRLGEHLPLRHLEEEMLSVVFKQNPHAGLRKTLHDLRRIATVVRDRLSIDTWRILNQLQQDMRLRHGRIQFEDVLAHLNRMITDLAAFSGMEMENMTRGYGWRFLDVGRRLERSINLLDLLLSVLAMDTAGAILEPLLEIADSAMTYRRRYFARPHLAPVLDLLLADETNTRALAFQLAALSEHIHHLPRDPRAPSLTREERLIDHAIGTLRQADIHGAHRTTLEGARPVPRVAESLASIEEDLRALSDALTYFYFSHADLRVS
jgi:uncharacterized circularly permuted ATP-grasp superfamily protein/uncharacterized alpha-E superfamily protein